jgi:hypothetical protein
MGPVKKLFDKSKLFESEEILSPSQKEWRFRIQNLSQKEWRFT